MGVSPGSYLEGMRSSVTNHDINLGIIKSLCLCPDCCLGLQRQGVFCAGN